MNFRISNKMLKVSLIAITAVLFFVEFPVDGIAWIPLANGPCTVIYQTGKSCDFPGSNVMQDLEVVDSKIDECYLKCLKKRTCTHFTHNMYKCILKRLNSAIKSSDVTPIGITGNGVCGRLLLWLKHVFKRFKLENEKFSIAFWIHVCRYAFINTIPLAIEEKRRKSWNNRRVKK